MRSIPSSSGDVMAAPAIEIENLVVEFPSSQGMLRAVDGVSLTVEQGEVLGIVGESGSGKSVAMLAAIATAIEKRITC